LKINNQRENIFGEAVKLEQGYNATAIRQIASAGERASPPAFKPVYPILQV